MKEDEHNLRNKVARGKFTAAFLAMSVRNWGSIIATGKWVVLAAATLGLGWLFEYYAERGLERCRDPRVQPGYATQDKSYAYQTLPDGRTRMRPFQSSKKHLNCESPDSKDDYENCQQWRSAEYTAEQACISTVQFWAGSIIGIIGLGGLLGTLYYASKTARISQDSAQRDLRAYVLFDCGSVEIATDRKSYSVVVRIRNTGRTPAWNLTHSIDSRIDVFPKKDEFDFLIADESESADLSSDNTMPLRKVTRPIAGNQWPELETGGRVIWVWGVLWYKDIYQRWQTSNFRAVATENENAVWPLRVIWIDSSDPYLRINYAGPMRTSVKHNDGQAEQ